MSEEIGRWDAMLLLTQSDLRLKGDERAIGLLVEILLEEIQTHHPELCLPDPEQEVVKTVSFPDTWKVWALTTTYKGVTNDYLQSELARRGHYVQVLGDEPKLEPCDCCGYETITSEGWDICPVCFWEDAATSLEEVNGANGISLKAARENFEAIGAVEEYHLQHVLPDGPRRFKRNPLSRF